MRDLRKGYRSLFLMPLILGMSYMVALNDVFKKEHSSNPCSRNDIISGLVSQDTFYTNDDTGKAFENVKVLLVGRANLSDSIDQLLDFTYTNAEGRFEFTGLREGDNYNIYFDSLPEGFGPTYSGNSSDARTLMRQVTVPKCDIHLGMSHPKDNVDPNARLGLACYEDGAALRKDNANQHPGFISIPFSPSHRGLMVDNEIQVAIGDIGSLWGTDYQFSNGTVYASAMLKRHVGLNPYVAPTLDGGMMEVPVDGIFMIQYRPTESFLGGFTIQGVNGIDLGTVKREILSYEVPLTNDSIESDKPYAIVAINDSTVNTESYDLDAYEKVGTVGFGSLSIGPNDRYLWLTNLNEKTLIRIDAARPDQLPSNGSKISSDLIESYPMDFTEIGSCKGQLRPWAVEFHEGMGYVGVVCDATDSGSAADLKAYILRFDPEEMNALENDFDIVCEFPLDYERENKFASSQQWHAWTVKDWPHPITDTRQEDYYAQPILSDIEFDGQSRIVISLMDRFGMQSSRENMAANISDQTPTFIGDAAGDVLLACPKGDGTFEVEGQGSCTHNNDDGPVSHGRLAMVDDGPYNAGEFFPFDHLTDYSGSSPNHYEITTGASAIHPHQEKVLHIVYDPMSANFSQGVHQYDLNDGRLNIAYQITPDKLSKANGLGDLALISEQVYMEIGNYVWFDENENGYQDTWEAPIEGVNVSILDMQGNILKTVRTNERGQYYFKNIDSDLDLKPFTMYHIVMGIDQFDTVEQVLLGQYLATVANQEHPVLGDEMDSDFENSDMAPRAYRKYPTLKITTGAAGYIDHSFDFGLIPSISPCPDFMALNSREPEGRYCHDQDVIIELEHTEDNTTIDLVYSSNDTLTAIDLYEGNWIELGVHMLEQNIQLTDMLTIMTLPPLPDGNWTVYALISAGSPLIDDPDCRPIAQTDIEIAEEMQLNLNDQSICEGSNVTLSPAISGGKAPLSYEWNTGDQTRNLQLYDVVTGNIYSITVTDAFGCQKVTEATVDVIPNLTVVLEDETVCEGNTVELIPAVSGGDGPYQYLWSTGEVTPTIYVLVDSDKEITVDVIDANGCEGTASMRIDMNNNLEINGTNPEYCEGYFGKIDLTISGSNGPYDIVWTPSWIGADGSFNADTSFHYRVLITDQITGCSGETTGQVKVHAIPRIDNPGDQSECEYFILPQITGDNLTSDASYYTRMQGMGIKYLSGDTLFSSTRLYIYDKYATIDSCNVEESFFVEVIELPPAVELTDGTICAFDSPYTPEEENIIDLNSLIVSGVKDGIWTAQNNSWIYNNHFLRLPADAFVDTVFLSYTIEADANQDQCGKTVFGAILLVDNCLAKLGDFVWDDVNFDGLQSPGEPGIEGVKVTLRGVSNSGSNITDAIYTDETGMYMFSLLPPGQYKITFGTVSGYTPTLLDNEIGGDDKDSDADPNNGLMTGTYELNPGDTILTIDAGFVKYAKIGDFVWHDIDADGIQDDSEPGLEGCKVVLTGTDVLGKTVDRMTFTDSTGMYMFGDLINGTYKVTFPSKDGWTATIVDSSDGDGTTDSDADPFNDNMTPVFVVDRGDTIPTIDAGFFRLSKLGDFVWEDMNANGIQEIGEPGIEGVEVILEGTDIMGNEVFLQTETDSTGMYMFGDLLSGTYKVTFGSKDNYILTKTDDPDNHGDDTNDSDAAQGNQMTRMYDLPAGDTILTIDAGFYRYAALGDYVWFDQDRDGLQDANEPCIDSALVYLYACESPNSPLDSMYTDGCRYLFDSLIPGDYFVRFVNPDDSLYSVTYSNQGRDDLDSDADNETLRSHCANLESGEVDLTLDMGLVTCPTLDSVACISRVQVSIGLDGMVEITPAMVTTITIDCEDLIVTVIDSMGNEYGNKVNCDMIGKDFRVMVVDAKGNACWGSLIIEDKIPPTITCPPSLEFNCNDDPRPGTSQTVQFEITPNASLGPDQGQSDEFAILVPDLGNVMVNGVNIYMDVNMENTQDYIAPGAFTLTSPNGTVYDIYPFNVNPNCQALFGVTGVDHGYDDNSNMPLAVCQDFQSGNTFIPFGANLDMTFQGEDEQGSWIFTITDQLNGQSGTVNRLWIELDLVSKLDLPMVEDNCSTILSYQDINDTRNVCGLGQITRIWTATDQGGNTSSCSQTLNFTNMEVTTITWPADYELECFVDPISLEPDQLNRPFDRPNISGDQNCIQYAIAYNDEFFDVCAPFGYKIRRTWSILDWCNPGFDTSYIQELKVIDTIAPSIACPGDFTVNLRHNDCTAVVSLPNAIAADNCDFNPVVTRELLDESGQVIPTVGVPVGSYIGRYIAVDACGNSDTCYFNIDVLDPVPPVAVCFRDLVVSLTSDGWAYICADQLDDGSNDNCTDVGLQIRREDEQNFSFYENQVRQNNCVRVQCRDIGELQVILRVWDDADGDGLFGPQFDTNGDGRIDETDLTGDNYSECWSNILVEDKLPPVLLCPPDITIGCLDDFGDLSITGEADANGNCVNIDALYSDDLPSKLCPGVTIIRTWSTEKRLPGHDEVLNTADDIVWTTACDQRITLEDLTPLQVLKLPKDLTIQCEEFTGVDPDDLTKFNYYDDYLSTPNNPQDDSLVVFDWPIIDYDCEDLAINYTDQEFVLCENSSKIKRTWTAIDWCNPDFELIHTQIILIDDTRAPTLSINVNNPGISESGQCSAQVDFDISTSDNCSSNVTIIHNSPYGSAFNDPSGIYPKGVYDIEIRAIDGCGNLTTEVVTINVADIRSPVAICKYGIAINMKPDGQVTLSAELLNIGSSDNCTSKEDLIFEVERLDENGQAVGGRSADYIFDCSHIGNNRMRLHVIDEAGNDAICETVVLVEDNGGYCLTNTAIVQGDLVNEVGTGISHVRMILNGQDLGEFSDGYRVDNIVVGDDISLEATRETDPREGVSTLDLIEIRKHILRVDTLDSPYLLLAADVDMNQSISVSDMIVLRQLILRKVDRFPNARSWQFIPSNLAFLNPMNPWEQSIPYTINLSIDREIVEFDFIGYKMGDVNRSLTLNNQIQRSNHNNLVWYYEWQLTDEGILLSIETGEEQLKGFQFCLSLNTSIDNIEARGILDQEHIGLTLKEEGKVMVSWDQTRDVRTSEIKLLVDSKERLSELMLDDEIMNSEAYSKNGEVLGIKLLPKSTLSSFEIYPNYPNPFSGNTLFTYRIPRSEIVRIEIFNVSGESVYLTKIDGQLGMNQFEISNDLLQGSGIYYYHVSTSEHSGVRKMISIE